MVAALSDDRYRALFNLHALLRDIDRFRRHDAVESSFRERLSNIQADVGRMVGSMSTEGALDAVREKLEDLARAVREYSPKYSLPDANELRHEWLRFRAHVGPCYEACAQALRRHESVRVPSLRPTNYMRSAAHLVAGLAAIATLEFILPMWVLPYLTAAMAATCWILEIKRRRCQQFNNKIFGFFKPIAHPREAHHVNSATWFVTALFALSLLQSTLAAAIAIAVLAIADPAAGVIGRRWGRTKIVNGRTLEGGLTFLLVGTAVSSLVIYWLHPEASVWPINLVVAGSAGLCGAIAELFSKHLDDNLTIPIATATATLVAGTAAGLPMW